MCVEVVTVPMLWTSVRLQERWVRLSQHVQLVYPTLAIRGRFPHHKVCALFLWTCPRKLRHQSIVMTPTWSWRRRHTFNAHWSLRCDRAPNVTFNVKLSFWRFRRKFTHIHRIKKNLFSVRFGFTLYSQTPKLPNSQFNVTFDEIDFVVEPWY